MFNANDIAYMRRALALAEQARFYTAPNPRVGCVLVREDRIIGEGATQIAGKDHAEIQAIKNAQQRGNHTQGATAYVSLEPCCHEGRTPPCTNALIDAQISCVKIALQDPNPRVAGRGMAQLRAAGIDTQTGLLEQEAIELNPGFIKRMQSNLPWIRLKLAASLDGKTALNNGLSQWITAEAARHDVHSWRAQSCALLTGIGTVLWDDPQMTVRYVETSRQPMLILLDSQLRVPLQAKIFEAPRPVLIACACPSDNALNALQQKENVEVLILPDSTGQRVDIRALMAVLAQREINEVHTEAGAQLNGALLDSGSVDELLIYLAPCFLGEGANMLNLLPLTALEQKIAFSFHHIERIGEDLRVIGRFS